MMEGREREEKSDHGFDFVSDHVLGPVFFYYLWMGIFLKSSPWQQRRMTPCCQQTYGTGVGVQVRACVLSHSIMSDSVWPQWTVACRDPLSMGFSRQVYWSGLPCPPPGALPDPGIKPESLASPALAAGSLPLAPPGKLLVSVVHSFLLLSLIPWHGWMYYDLFNHSPIEEHLGCLSFGEIYFTISFSILKFMYLLFWNRQFFLHFSFFCFYF